MSNGLNGGIFFLVGFLQQLEFFVVITRSFVSIFIPPFFSRRFLSTTMRAQAVPSMTAFRENDWVGVKSVSRLKRTMKFNGIRNRYDEARLDSGTMLPFKIPITGK